MELKLLPTSRHYERGMGKFKAGANNKRDFDSLADGSRDGIIYIYWADEDKWRIVRTSLLAEYPVICVRETGIDCTVGTATLSYWRKR